MKMKNTLLLLCGLIAQFCLFSQSNIQQSLSINSDGSATDPSAQLDVSATDKGMLVPRMTTGQRTAITTPATGLLVFDTDTGSFWFYTGTSWSEIPGTYAAGAGISIAANIISNTGDTNAADDLTNGSAAGGDLTGTYPNPTVAADAIGSSEIADGTVAASDLAVGVIPSTLPPSGTAGGDLTGTYPNPTVGSNAIGSSEITDGSISISDLAFTSLPPNGAAGGDLTGTYPNPTVGSNAIGSSEITDGSIATSDLAFTSLPPNGTAGGDLTGTYPNPDIAASAVGTNELAGTSVTSAKISSGAASNGQLLTANGSGGAAWSSPATQTKIQDADTDTKIQVEESADEDIIRFDLGGTENMVLRKNGSGAPRLELISTAGNTFIGENAGLSNTTGTNNAGHGKNALCSNTTGFSNTAVGVAALYSNTTSDNLVAVGDSTLYNNTGSNNTAIGSKSLFFNTSGSQNTAVGTKALNANTTGNDNVAVGREAMLFNTDGFNNTAIGESSLRNNTTGDNNTALGNTALRNNTEGNRNTASGLQALYNNSTGNDNTADGFNALTSNTAGTGNTGIGNTALEDNTTGNNNTALGFGAGRNNATGSGNVFLGKDAGGNETGSDKLYIDNSNTSNPLIFGNLSTNRVGINTGSPTATLHVEGSVTFGSTSFAFYANDGGSDCEQTGCSTSPSDVSIYASNRVRASEFNAFSDARIKRIEHRSDPVADLATLSGLKVTDYHYVDVVGKGGELKKGFIAQEVEQVFPEAVSRSREFVPNVYHMATTVKRGNGNLLTIYMDTPHGLAFGDKVRLISNGTYEKEIIALSLNSFTVADWTEKDTKQVFVFGKEVEDFRNVDYDRIFTLNVSAVQALASKVETLEAENAALKIKLEGFSDQFEKISAALQGAGIAVEK